jgi:acyl carrier protein
MNKSPDEQQIQELVEKIALKKIAASDRIISDKILDSVAQVDFVLALEETYKISISALEITPQNFDDIRSIKTLVVKKMSLQS